MFIYVVFQITTHSVTLCQYHYASIDISICQQFSSTEKENLRCLFNCLFLLLSFKGNSPKIPINPKYKFVKISWPNLVICKSKYSERVIFKKRTFYFFLNASTSFRAPAFVVLFKLSRKKGCKYINWSLYLPWEDDWLWERNN